MIFADKNQCKVALVATNAFHAILIDAKTAIIRTELIDLITLIKKIILY